MLIILSQFYRNPSKRGASLPLAYYRGSWEVLGYPFSNIADHCVIALLQPEEHINILLAIDFFLNLVCPFFVPHFPSSSQDILRDEKHQNGLFLPYITWKADKVEDPIG